MNKYNILILIKNAITANNGVASLSKIYDFVLNHKDADFSKYSNPKSIIRKILYLHSSDCDIFKGTRGDSNDIFYTVKQKGSGFWGIRDFNFTDENSLFDNVYLEGDIFLKTHLIRERNPLLIKEAKKMFELKNNGQLFCEICKFDFQKTYGSIGKGYIEGHHIIPISSFNKEYEVKIEDIALICSNCHSMLHRRTPPYQCRRSKKNYRKI